MLNSTGAATCEGCHSIDLAWLRRRGMLAPGRYSTLTRSQGGQETGSITLAAQHDGVHLIYRTKDSDGLSVKVDEFVAFSHTPTRFGGLRQWLRCLKCGRGWKPMVQWLHIIANTVAEDRSPPTKRMADRGARLPTY